MAEKHNWHVRQHPALNDTNNCTVRALRDAFGVSIITAYVHMAKHGRPHAKGPTWSGWKRAAKDMAKQRGYYMKTLSRLTARRLYGATIVTAQRKIQPHQRLVINQRGHTMGWSNGQTTDWAEGRRKRTHTVWEFLPRGEGPAWAHEEAA